MARTEATTELVRHLLGSYTLEAEIYQVLLGIANEQGDILEESGDVDRCAALFGRKDELLRSIARIETEIEPLKQQWWGEQVDLESRERLNGLLDCILATIEAIMAQEQRNEQLLLSRQEEVQAGLSHLRQASALGRVAGSDEPLPRFMDVSR